MRRHKLLKYLLLGITIFLLIVGSTTNIVVATQPQLPQAISQTDTDRQTLTQTGRTHYQNGQFAAAIQLWQSAATAFAAQGDWLNQAMVLSNLALAHQQLGQWPQSQQAIAQSLQLLGCSISGAKCPTAERPQTKVIAQALSTLGSLQLGQGDAEQALNTWEQAIAHYQKVNDQAGIIRTQINQAQAMRSTGLYRRAAAQLARINQTLAQQSDPVIKTAGLLSYGEALRLMGRLKQSQAILEQGLQLAQQQKSAQDMATAYLNLGNTVRAQINAANDDRAQLLKAALRYYQQATEKAPNATLKISAQLNQFNLLIENQSWQNATTLAQQLLPQFANLPLSRTKVYAQISYANSLTKLVTDDRHSPNFPPLSTAAHTLAEAVQQSSELQDWRAKSFALGYLGHVYEINRQYADAIALTQQGLVLAHSHQAPDIAYRWEWQAGRLYRDLATSETTQNLAENAHYQKAIAAYKATFHTLQSLRRDLAAGNADRQFDFQEQTEQPIYRELVDLLLRPRNPSQENLLQARQVIESLQIVELENFLQEPCVAANPASIDGVVDNPNSTTAALFPIILPDRIEVILKLPRQKELLRYSYPIAEAKVQQTVEKFYYDLQLDYGFASVKQDAKLVYDWLIAPARQQLEAAKVDTLVFVPDSQLRNIPMAALYDGQQFLVENFATTVALNLELQNPKPLPQKLKVLAASLTNPPQNFNSFAQLANVNLELEAIAKAGIAVTPIRDERFTTDEFSQKISAASFSIVHLATHGQFSSDPQKTFLLTASGAIKVEDFGSLFRTRGLNRSDEIELLVLSACETASGDNRATLGIAGTTVRAGARSAIASLWSLDDESSVEIMKQFYQQLGRGQISRAAALRQAQQTLMQNPQYAYPRYWAPFILLGNWL
jgi:CHAT domain-containing protein